MGYDLAAIRSQRPISEVIGDRLALKREGREYVCLCPFHAERTPSFKINDDKEMFYCFGCEEHGDVFDFIQKFHQVDFQTACEILGGRADAIAAPHLKLVKKAPPTTLVTAPVPESHEPFAAGHTITAWNPKEDRDVSYKPDDVWAYKTVDGELTHYVIRINFSPDRKLYIPLRPVEHEGATVWAVAHPNTPRPLYGLERLAGDDRHVWVCEGEKSADACAKIIGFPSVSAPKGDVDFSPLFGRRVVIWGDADEAGQKHAIRVANRILEAGAQEVKIIEWDRDKPRGWDAGDALTEGATKAEILAWAKANIRVVKEVAPDPDPEPTGPVLELTGFDGELPRPRPWAWGDFLMEGAVTGVPSPPGTGKTTFAMQLGIAFALDQPLGPWKPRPGGGGKVLVLNGEEPKDELDRRFLAACTEGGVDPQKLSGRMFYNSVLNPRDPMRFVVMDRETDMAIFTAKVDLIKETVRTNGIKLLIIDPLIEFHGVKENDLEAFGTVGAALRDIAVECQCAVAVFHHTPKAATSDNSAGDMNAMRGGGSLLGVVRFITTIFRMSKSDAAELDIPAKDRTQFVRIDGGKANMSALDGEGHWFRLVGVGIDNACDPRPADSVAALRYHPLSNDTDKEIEKQARRVKERDSVVERVAAEIVRICLQNGWTNQATAPSLNVVCNALDDIKSGVSSRSAINIVLGNIFPVWTDGDHSILIDEHIRGKTVLRTLYVSEASK